MVIRQIFGWVTVINLTLLILWFFILIFARRIIYRLHRHWFKLSRRSFDITHYSGLIFFKISILIFNVIPYFVLVIVT
ncbi:MAG: hypothetical protein GY817_00475 [bacterium]|nr:hypothetical protein [bacterium]